MSILAFLVARHCALSCFIVCYYYSSAQDLVANKVIDWTTTSVSAGRASSTLFTLLTCAPMYPSSFNRKIGRQTIHVVYISCKLFSLRSLQQMMYCHKISYIDQRKRVLIDCRAQLSQSALNWAIDQLPKRLMMVIKANGAYVEFRLE